MSARVESGTTSTQPSTEQGPTRAERVRDAYHKEAVESGLRDIALIKDVWPFLRPQKVWLSVALVCVVLTAGLSLLRPLIMLWTIDGSLASKDPSVMLRGGALFAAVMVAEQLLSFVQIYATQVVGARAMADLRLAVFRFIGQLPLRFFDRQPVGRLVTRVTNDVDSIQELFASGALNALGDLIRLVGVVVLMIGAMVGLATAAPGDARTVIDREDDEDATGSLPQRSVEEARGLRADALSDLDLFE